MIARPRGRALLLVGATAVVALVVGVALVVLPTPEEARQIRIDEHRIRDLGSIAYTVNAYWSQKKTVPQELEELFPRVGALPRDPVSGELYRYRALGADTYELCATFSLAASSDGRGPGHFPSDPRRPFLEHPPGEHCFELEAKSPLP